jgi:serine/threonine protein kinase
MFIKIIKKNNIYNIIYMDGGKLIDEGGFGCVFNPPINCSGKESKNKNYVSKIQKYNKDTQKEIKNGLIIMTIKHYNNFFAPIIRHCPIYISSISPELLEGCSDNIIQKKSDIKYMLVYSKFIKGLNFSDTLKEIYTNASFSNTYYKYYLNLLNSIKILQTKNIVHYDIKSSNIIINKTNNNPILIDFGISMHIDTENLHKNYKYFYIYAPDYYYWPFECIFISWVLNEDDNKLNHVITNDNIIELVNEYFDNHMIFNFDNDFFSETFLRDFKKSYIEYYITSFSGIRGKLCLESLLKTWKYWDLFSLSQLFLAYLKYYDESFHNENKYNKFIELLVSNIVPDYSERPNMEDNINEMNLIMG